MDGGPAKKKAKSLVIVDLSLLAKGIPYDAAPTPYDDTTPHAPRRNPKLSDENVKLALQNAMRYVPPRLHAEMLPEAARELADHGHIYFHRWRPTNYARENLLQRTFVDKAQHSHGLDFHFRAFL